MKKLMTYFVRLLCCSLFFTHLNAHATVGGSDGYDILGYDVKEHKVFFIISDGDGSGFVDQLYYFNTAQAQPKPILAKSYYGRVRYQDCEDKCRQVFAKKLNQLKKRLIPFIQLSMADATWSVIDETSRTVEWGTLEASPPFETPTQEKNTTYEVTFQDSSKTTYASRGQMLNYGRANISGFYFAPKLNAYLAVMTYLGKPYEFGYDMHQVLLLKPS